MSIKTIKKRYDFSLSHKLGKKKYGKYLNIQLLNRKDNTEEVFFGFTITKKIGISVIRNKIRRRLKSIIISLNKDNENYFNIGYNYVFVGKPSIINASFKELKEEIIISCKK